MKQITPLADRVLIRPEKAPSKIGNILLPETAQVPALRGEVLRVGPGKRHPVTGELIPVAVECGDVVMYAKYASHHTENIPELEGLIVVNESDLIAKVD